MSPEQPSDTPRTGIIRRQPTEMGPTLDDDRTTYARVPVEPDQTSFIGHARQPTPEGVVAHHTAGPGAAVAAAVAAVLSGWATAMIATDLISGWWHTDRLFCVAIGFLAAISAGASVGGLITLLLRHRVGQPLVVVGSAIGLLIFGSLFLAGAKLHPVVYGMPVLPVAAIILVLLPATRRWSSEDEL